MPDGYHIGKISMNTVALDDEGVPAVAPRSKEVITGVGIAPSKGVGGALEDEELPLGERKRRRRGE